MDNFVDLVFDNNLDILVSQEGQNDAVQKFVNKLNDVDKDHQWTHASVMSTFLCNSIISRYPIVYENTADWDWAQQKNDSFSENRCAVMAKILVPHNKNKSDSASVISIMCTHLDHQNEDHRILQMNHFLKNIMTIDNSKRKKRNKYANNDNDEEKKESANMNMQKKADLYTSPDIICGDFNSLLRSDYNEELWNKIETVRSENSWEDPRTDLMYQLLIDQGYNDSLEIVLKQRFYKEQYAENDTIEWSEFNEAVNLSKWFKQNVKIKNNEKEDGDTSLFKRLFGSRSKSMNNRVNSKVKKNMDMDIDEEMKVNENDDKLEDKWNKSFFEYFIKHWHSTCRFETRIDYILVLDTLLNGGEWKLVNAGFVDTIETGLTDHNLYWCDIQSVN